MFLTAIREPNQQEVVMKSMRRSVVENLETRRMFSGNVAVAFDGQLLDVRGDELGNNISINQSAAGVITVVGSNGTLINGLPSVRFANGASIEQLSVRMEGGGDRVTLNRLNTASDVNIDLGISGVDRDTLVVNRSVINGSLFAYGGGGSDTINLANTFVGLDATIDHAEGAGRSVITAMDVLGSATWIGGEGADVLSATGFSVGLEMKIETKEGNDQVTLVGSSTAIAGISTDAGADRVTIRDFLTRQDLSVETGVDNDVVTLERVFSSKNLLVNLDAGNDLLTVLGASATEDAIVVGGSGVDRIVGGSSLFGGIKREVTEFELFA